MASLISRFVVSLVVLVLSTEALRACDCEAEVYYDCECEAMWGIWEPYVPCCTEGYSTWDDCVFSETNVDSPHGSGEQEQPQSEVEPKAKMPTPADEEPAPIKPAAPIAVPQPEKAVVPPTEDLFPGPIPPADEATPQLEPEKISQIDELFEEPAATSEPPAVPSNEPTAPEADSTDALFVEPQQDTAPVPAEEPPVTEETITGEESTEPEPSAGADEKSDSFEDLFGPTDEKSVPEPKIESEKQPAPDPFSQKALPTGIRGAKSIASSEPRHWSDSSAQFSCLAYLVSMNAEFVVLEKESGDRIAVPYSQLSDTDLAFVKGQIHNLRMVLAREALAAQLAASWSN